MEKKVYEEVCDKLKGLILSEYKTDFNKEKMDFSESIFGFPDKKKEKLINKQIKLKKANYTRKHDNWEENISQYFSDSVLNTKMFFIGEFADCSLDVNIGIHELKTLDLNIDIIYDLENFINHKDPIDHPFGLLYKNLKKKLKDLKMIEFLFLEKANLQAQEKKEEEVSIDYSDSTIAEKIIALNEGGVIDFLKEKEPFNVSTNSLAAYLSLCMGVKTTSIQSYIQPIINKKSDQDKSPYKTDTTVKKVKQKLINIGLKIE